MAVLLQQQMPAAPSYQQWQRTRHCYLVSNVPPYIIIDLVLHKSDIMDTVNIKTRKSKRKIELSCAFSNYL